MNADAIRKVAVEYIRRQYPVARARAATARTAAEFAGVTRGDDTYIGGFEDGADFVMSLIYAAVEAEEGEGGTLKNLQKGDEAGFLAATLLAADDTQEAEVARLKGGGTPCPDCGQVHHVEPGMNDQIITPEIVATFSMAIINLMGQLGIDELNFSPEGEAREEANGLSRGLQMTGHRGDCTLKLISTQAVSEQLTGGRVH